MGVDPATMAMFAGSLGGNVLNQLFAPEGQDVRSFADEGFSPNINPAAMLENLQIMLHELYGDLGAAAREPVSVAGSEVQPLPVFSGGGLPMPIGAVGRDFAWDHPDLLFKGGGVTEKRPGPIPPNEPDGGPPIYRPGPNRPMPQPSPQPSPEPLPGNPDDPFDYRKGPNWDRFPPTPIPPPTYPGGDNGPMERGRDLMGGGMGDDDLEQGRAAIDLLLATFDPSMTSGGGTASMPPPRRAGGPRRRAVSYI